MRCAMLGKFFALGPLEALILLAAVLGPMALFGVALWTASKSRARMD
jgi:hypothetical protein